MFRTINTRRTGSRGVAVPGRFMKPLSSWEIRQYFFIYLMWHNGNEGCIASVRPKAYGSIGRKEVDFMVKSSNIYVRIEPDVTLEPAKINPIDTMTEAEFSAELENGYADCDIWRKKCGGAIRSIGQCSQSKFLTLFTTK